MEEEQKPRHAAPSPPDRALTRVYALRPRRRALRRRRSRQSRRSLGFQSTKRSPLFARVTTRRRKEPRSYGDTEQKPFGFVPPPLRDFLQRSSCVGESPPTNRIVGRYSSAPSATSSDRPERNCGNETGPWTRQYS